MFEYIFEDEEGNEHSVEVEYNYIPFRPATYLEPSEGGVEIERVTCSTKVLTKQEELNAQEACVEYVYSCERENG